MHGICTERIFLPYKSTLWVISITIRYIKQFELSIVLTKDGLEPKINFSQSWLIFTYFLALFLAPFSSPTALLQEKFTLGFVYILRALHLIQLCQNSDTSLSSTICPHDTHHMWSIPLYEKPRTDGAASDIGCILFQNNWTSGEHKK